MPEGVRKKPPYAAIIAQIVDRQRGDVLVRLITDTGEPLEVWLDDSHIAFLSEADALRLAGQGRISVPPPEKDCVVI